MAPGARVATGQAPVVGGNAAGARDRALDEAMRQAVDLALADLADAPTRAAQAKAIKAIEAKARSFVPRYRTLEEGEANGVYTVRIEAEVDEVALRRKIDRWTSGPPVAAPPPPGAPAVLIVPGDRLESTSALPADLGDGAVVLEGARAGRRRRRRRRRRIVHRGTGGGPRLVRERRAGFGDRHRRGGGSRHRAGRRPLAGPPPDWSSRRRAPRSGERAALARVFTDGDRGRTRQLSGAARRAIWGPSWGRRYRRRPGRAISRCSPSTPT